MVHEYNGSNKGPPCAYSNLCSYNNSYSQGVLPPLASRAMGQTISLVPAYGSFAYRNTNNTTDPMAAAPNGSCNGYYSISQAYPGNNNCSQFTTQMCNQQQ